MIVVHSNISKVVGYDYTNDKKPFYLMRSVLYAVIEDITKTYYQVEKDYKFDGSSIPRLFWRLIGCPHTPKYLPAAIIHDWFCDYPEKVNYDRKRADTIFKELLISCGVSKLKAEIMFLCVEIWQIVSNLWTHKWK